MLKRIGWLEEQSSYRPVHMHSRAKPLLTWALVWHPPRRCMAMDATDGRAYVALGKLLGQQRRTEEARQVYDEGSTATGGRSEYIWQAWATLEARAGNAPQARRVSTAAPLAPHGVLLATRMHRGACAVAAGRSSGVCTSAASGASRVCRCTHLL